MLTLGHGKSSQCSQCLPRLWILPQGLAPRQCVRGTSWEVENRAVQVTEMVPCCDAPGTLGVSWAPTAAPGTWFHGPELAGTGLPAQATRSEITLMVSDSIP